MSMKSFDKFCEKMVNNEPLNEKAIFDERQNQLRQKYTIEALYVFGGCTFLNTLIMECGLQWSESYAMPMVIFAVISYLYWIIRNAAKGTLFGVNGTRAVSSTGFVCTALGACYFPLILPQSVENWDTFFISNGMIGEHFLLTIADALYFGVGIAVLIATHKYKKSLRESSEE